MSLEKTFKISKDIYMEKVKVIFKDDLNNPNIYIYLENFIDEEIRVAKKDIMYEELSEPLPGRFAQEVIKKLCLTLILDTLKTEDELQIFINYKLLGSDAYRLLYDKNEEYRCIIDNLTDDFYAGWYANTKGIKKTKLFTLQEKVGIAIACITPFIIFALIYIARKYAYENRAKKIFNDPDLFTLITYFKYSEFLTTSMYEKEYKHYDADFRDEVEKEVVE